MAIQVTNFNPVWKYENVKPETSNQAEYSDGSYIFINCETVNKTLVTIRATIYNQDPSITGTKLRGHMCYEFITMNVEGNLLGLAHDYIIAQLTTLNPGVTFTKVSIA
jgi:type IV secretory pathway component VirB8